MRFIHPPKPKDNDERVIIKFLWFPCRIKNETRWLEFAEIKQFYRKRKPLSRISSRWFNKKFVNTKNL